MSEYWKSTPKYWCKHCSAYVKDTPFERKQHETTAKHQGNLKRFLRGIQNDHERGEREKEKVKAEIARLNKVAGTSNGIAADPSLPTSSSVARTSSAHKPATGPLSANDQKKQWAQLAEMGIQVPDGFRAEMAMPGEWQQTARHSTALPVEEESLNTGIRKRKFEDQEEEEVLQLATRRGWGSTTKRYPGKDQDDLEALLNETYVKKVEPDEELVKVLIDKHRESDVTSDAVSTTPVLGDRELTSNTIILSENTEMHKQNKTVKSESFDDAVQGVPADSSATAASPVLFKKRKSKAK